MFLVSVYPFNFYTNQYLSNLGEFAARKVDEGQVTESQGYGWVALDKRFSIGICGQLLMNNGIMTKETSMGTESDTTQVTPITRKRNLVNIVLGECMPGYEFFLYLPECSVRMRLHV